METNLYVTTGTGQPRYWYVGEPSCSFCEKKLFLIGFFIQAWGRDGKSQDMFICENCISKIPELMPKYPIQERKQIIICDSQPPQSRVVISKRPDLTPGCISVFDAARSNKGIQSDTSSCVTKDLTRYAGRPGYTFGEGPTMIGEDVHDLLEEKDKKISTREGIELLDDLQKSERQIPGSDQKKIEGGV